MIEFIVTSSVLITVIIVLRFFFRGKISRRLQYALWGLVLLRLLIPFPLFGSRFSVMNLVVPDKLAQASAVMPVYTGAADAAGYPSQNAANFIQSTSEGSEGSGSSRPESSSNAGSSKLTPERVLALIWLAGSVAAGCWFLGTNLTFYKKLKAKRAVFAAPGAELPVYIAEGLVSPCLFGLLHPAVYLTPKAAENESARFAIAHETCHYRHGDHIWPILWGLCLAVWWWHPLVWAAAILSRQDSELACDEAVIRRVGEENRLAYGRTLIDMVAVKKEPTGIMCAATAMSAGKYSIKGRLNMIVRKPKTFVPAVVAVLMVAAVCAGCTFTGARSSAAPSESETGDNSDASSYAQELYNKRNLSVGDASADGALLTVMGITEKLGQYSLELETNKEPYILRVVFSDVITDAAALNSVMNDNAMLLLALIGNASEIQWRYTYQDKGADGTGQFTGSLTAADAAASLNNTDIKSYGKSAADVQALLDWQEARHAASTIYELTKLTKGEAQYPLSSLTGADLQLAKDVIMSYMLKSAAWPGVDIKTLNECYLLRETYYDGTVSDYYAYQMDGGAVLQAGADGMYSRIDDGLYERLVALVNGNTPMGGDIGQTDLETAVSNAILSENEGHYIVSGDFSAGSHSTLKTVESGSTATVYVMAMYMVFSYTGDGFAEVGGSHTPAAITFEKDSAGKYVLQEYWTPEEGSSYGPSIKKKFPADIYNDAMDTQQFVTANTQACYAQAIEYGNTDVGAHLKKLVDTICSAPSLSSNSQDYIDAHPIEFREMIFYGSYTLRYCFGLFENGNQTGLEGHILAAACIDIIGEAAKLDVPASNGQEWYDAFKASAQTLRDTKGADYVKENAPGMWILLQMLEQ